MTDEMQPQIQLSMSPTIGAIAAALAKAQAVMGPAIKDSVNPHFKSNYASLAACFEALAPLHANGIGVTQIPIDGGPNGVAIATLLLHASGEWLRGDLWMPVSKQDAQGYGSAYTYARRYGLQAMTGLASDDDDGNEAVTGGPPRGPQRQSARPAPAKAAAPHDLGAFATLCDRVDAAETAADLNAVASSAQKARRDGVISDSHIEQIKASVTKKRGLLGQPAQTNGGAA